MADLALEGVRPYSSHGQSPNQLCVVAGYLNNYIEDPKELSYHLLEVGVLSAADVIDINEERGDFKARSCLVQKLVCLADERKTRLFEEVLSANQPRVAAGMKDHREQIRLKLDNLTRRLPRSVSSVGELSLADSDSGVSSRVLSLSPTELSDDGASRNLSRKGFVDEIVNQMLSRVTMCSILPLLTMRGFLTGEEVRALSSDLEGHENLARAKLFFILFHRKGVYELSQIIDVLIEAQPDVLRENSERDILDDVQRSVIETARPSTDLEHQQVAQEDVPGFASTPAIQISTVEVPPATLPIRVSEMTSPIVPTHVEPATEDTKAESLLVVLGASSAGKSTLVNTLFGDELAKVGSNVFGTTKSVSVYTQSIGEAVLQIADTVGYSGATPLDPATKDGFPLGADSRDVYRSGLILFCSKVTDSPHIEYSDRLAIQHLKNEYGLQIFDHFIIVLTQANLLLEKRREEYKTVIQALTEGWYKMLSDLLGKVTAGKIRVLPAGKNPEERLCEIDWYSELWLSCSEQSSREHSRALWQIATTKGSESRKRSGSFSGSHFLQIPESAHRTTATPSPLTSTQRDLSVPTSVSGAADEPQPTPNREGPPVSAKVSGLTKWQLVGAKDHNELCSFDERDLPMAIFMATAQGAFIGGAAGALVGLGVGAGVGVLVGVLAGVLLYLFRKHKRAAFTKDAPGNQGSRRSSNKKRLSRSSSRSL